MESSVIDLWLFTLLSADSELSTEIGTSLFNTERPSGDNLPCVVYQVSSPGNDFLTMGGVRIWSNMTYLVRAVVEGKDYDGSAKRIANRIDAVLHRQSGSNVEGVVYACVRIRPYLLPVTIGSQSFRELGGFYRIQARKT